MITQMVTFKILITNQSLTGKNFEQRKKIMSITQIVKQIHNTLETLQIIKEIIISQLCCYEYNRFKRKDKWRR
jgi:hypothetical protein